ncbi:MAG: aminomethyltransferase family protein [Anaerolineae bacterium]
MKRSPFYCDVQQAGPQWAVVQGWEVPNVFTSAREEHLAVRQRAGIFDWSSTGEIEVQGPDALHLVQKVIVNDAAGMPIGKVLYTTMLLEDGGIFSDITVYRLGESHYMLMTAWGSNAANDRPEYEWLLRWSEGLDVAVTDVSSGTALLAVQGPLSRPILQTITQESLEPLGYMWAMPAHVAGIRALISRTGYTGELGYEVLVPAEHAHDFWEAITAAGRPYGMALCGMESAFSLRLEKGYIMRHDFAGGRTPYEAGLGWTVKLEKGDFIGREALLRRRAEGFREKLCLLQVEDAYVPASGDALLIDNKEAGKVTSAAFGHSVGHPLALGYLPTAHAQEGTAVAIRDSAGGTHPARVVRRPLYDPEGTRLRM